MSITFLFDASEIFSRSFILEMKAKRHYETLKTYKTFKSRLESSYGIATVINKRKFLRRYEIFTPRGTISQ